MNLSFRFSKLFSADSCREILDLLIEASYLAVIFLVPLWFAYLFPTYNIFELNKLVIFKILTWLLFFFTALKLIFFHSSFNFPFRAFFKKYWFIPLIFIAGLSLTLLFSDNPTLSFYGSIGRQAGLISFLFYFFWFILFSFNLLTVDNHQPQRTDSKNKKIKRVVSIAVISASLVSIYGILQILDIDFIFWPESVFSTNRTFSTFGQPNFLASWLVMVIPLSLYAAYSARRFLIKFLYLLAFILQLVCLFLTGSRGGLLALLFAGALYLIYLFINSPWTHSRKFLVGLGFVSLTAIMLFAANRFLPGRISDIFDYKSGSVGARANFYTAAADSLKARPLFGYGLENGDGIFIKYYEPDWAVYGDVGQTTDKAHNLILDTILSVGFYGLVLFILLYYFFFSLAQENIKKKRQLGLSLALALGAAAYLFSLLFSFSVATGEVYFWLFLALLAIANYEHDEISSRHGTKKINFFIRIILALAAVILVFWQISLNFQTLTADYYFNKIYFTLAELDYFTALTLDGYLKEQKINPINRAAYDSFWADKLSGFYPSIDELAAKKIVTAKLEEINHTLPENNYMDWLNKAKINNALGRYALAQSYLDRVIALTPHWPVAYIEQGRLSVNQRDYKKALVACNLILLNLPAADDSRLNEPHRQLVRRFYYFAYHSIGDIYEQENNYAAAEKYFWLAYKSDPSDYSLLKRIADTYYSRGNLKKAIEYTQRGLARDAKDYKWPLALAVLYHESGDQKRASEYLDRAWQLAPGNQDIIDLQKAYGKR